VSEEKILKIYNYAKIIVKRAGFDPYLIYIRDLLGKDFYKFISLNEFFKQYVWVVFTSGFNASIVRKNWGLIKNVLYGLNVEKVCKMNETELFERIPIKNKLKICSIINGSKIITNSWLNDIRNANDFEVIKKKLIELPHISNVTVYHLMRNIGIDCFKPDRHITNLSNKLNLDTRIIFKIIIKNKREKYIGLADYILWRASSLLGVENLIQYALNEKPFPEMDLSKKEDINEFML